MMDPHMFLEGYLKNPEVYDTARSTMGNYTAQPDLGDYAGVPLMDDDIAPIGPELPRSMRRGTLTPNEIRNIERIKRLSDSIRGRV